MVYDIMKIRFENSYNKHIEYDMDVVQSNWLKKNFWSGVQNIGELTSVLLYIICDMVFSLKQLLRCLWVVRIVFCFFFSICLPSFSFWFSVILCSLDCSTLCVWSAIDFVIGNSISLSSVGLVERIYLFI